MTKYPGKWMYIKDKMYMMYKISFLKQYSGKWMYTHTVRKEVAGEMVETRTNVSRQIYDQLLAQVVHHYHQD